MSSAPRYDAILFDLLTALLDSWSLWNSVAGSEERGRAWRAAYLRLTYGAGAYRPYEELVAEAAEEASLPVRLALDLEERWRELKTWPGVVESLARLRAEGCKLGIVTNCSEELGRVAAAITGTFDVVVTAERAGFYKPDPRPYRMALDELGTKAERTLFVAGSAFDLGGAARVRMPVFWHNRIGMNGPESAPRPLVETADFADLVRFVAEGV